MKVFNNIVKSNEGSIKVKFDNDVIQKTYYKTAGETDLIIDLANRSNNIINIIDNESRKPGYYLNLYVNAHEQTATVEVNVNGVYIGIISETGQYGLYQIYPTSMNLRLINRNNLIIFKSTDSNLYWDALNFGLRYDSIIIKNEGSNDANLEINSFIQAGNGELFVNYEGSLPLTIHSVVDFVLSQSGMYKLSLNNDNTPVIQTYVLQ